MGDEQGARERFTALGEIAAEMAHELRNTLLIISASAYLARQDPPESAPHIAKIERNARLAQAMVDDLMALARGDARTRALVPLADVLVRARAELSGGAAIWKDELDPPTIGARVHPGLGTRLFHALYENAILMSAPRAPLITTRALLQGDRVVIEVADDGPGLRAELGARVFEPLVTGREGGTGLGLALARRIAMAHGGTIALVPSATGAVFRLELHGSM